jgi:glyoxylase-like metal-dependent hydrolase (beta-lactamase superfamily II)
MPSPDPVGAVRAGACVWMSQRRWTMLNLSRRDFVVSTGLAAALGLNARLAVSPAFAQTTPDPARGFVSYKVGAAEVTALYDGIWEKPHDPAFIANASVEDVKAAMVKAGLPADFVSIPFTVVVVRNAGKTILCDSGTGGQVQPTAGKMMTNMKAAGIDPAIDTILISHCHPDHIFGLMEKDTNKPVFPNAEIVISDAEYKFWTDPAVIDRLPEARKGLARRIQAVFPTWKNIRQVEGEPEVAPGIRFASAPGHTPGHRAFHLASGSSQLMISNDTAYVPALVVANPGWRGVYDQDGALAEASRRKLLDRVIADKIMICGYHFPFPGAGTIVKDGAGYALTVKS